MVLDTYEYVRQIATELNSKLKNNETGTVVGIRHYNSLTITKAESSRLESVFQNCNVIYHHFDTSDVVKAYEPFFDVIKSMVLKNNIDIDELMDKCNVYKLHRSVIKACLEGKIVTREEDYIYNELEYESKRMRDAIVDILCFLAKDKKIIFILNKLHKCGLSTIEIVREINNRADNNIGIIFTYNDFANIPEYMKKDWDRFIEGLKEQENMKDWGFNTPLEKEKKSEPFLFHSGKMMYYLDILESMFNFVALRQANDFAYTLHHKLLIEELNISPANMLSFYEIYAKIAIYVGDTSSAMIACDYYEKMMQMYPSAAKKYKYYYLLSMTQTYIGQSELAIKYAGECKSAAEEIGTEYMKFKADLLEHMALYSGWNDIWLCDKSYGVSEKLINEADKYNYRNHLAHIYIFALDSAPELYSKVEGIEERLVNFNKGIQIAEEIDNQFLIMYAYRKNLMIASTNGYFDVSRYYATEMIQPLITDNHFEQGNIYNDLGYNSCAVERYREANDYFLKALEIFIDMEKIEYIGETLYNMAINGIMAYDYNMSVMYLNIVIRIINTFHWESLRVAHISKIFGLKAYCEYKIGNIYEGMLNLNFAEQFLKHIMDSTDKYKAFLYWDDDLFLYHMCKGILSSTEKDYSIAEKEYKKSSTFGGPGKGGATFYYSIYAKEIAKIYYIEGRKEEAEEELTKCYEFYKEAGRDKRANEIRSLINNPENLHEDIKSDEMELISDELLIRLEKILTKAKNDFDFELLEGKFKYINTWQKLQNIEYNNVEHLINNSIVSLMNEFSFDKAIMVRINDDDQLKVEYNNIGIKMNNEKVGKLYEYFSKHHSVFATSKLNKNFFDYEEVSNVFEESHLCALIGVPLYKSERLEAFVFAYILMNDNWGAASNKIVISGYESKFFEFLFKQLVESIDRFETNRRIEKQNIELSRLNGELSLTAITDQLTGLYNRQGFSKSIEDIIFEKTTAHKDLNITIIYCDLDKFKLCNDTYGHRAGDVVLKEFAKLIRDASRNIGQAIRYGGDEFVIILDSDNRTLAENIVGDIYDTLIETKGFSEEIGKEIGKDIIIEEANQVSVSVGVSFVNGEVNMENIMGGIHRADEALYYAKTHGKGKGIFWNDIQ